MEGTYSPPFQLKADHIHTNLSTFFQSMWVFFLLQARAFFQAAVSLAPHMYEPHYNWAALADQVG